eukprot:3112807-Amphidinium_carterae.1
MDSAETQQYPWSFLIRLGTLPHAALFTDALWTESTKMVACVEDAKDFFYLLAMPEVRHRESAFGIPVRAELVSHLMSGHQDPDCLMVPVLTSVAMGDQKAMFLAQTAHQHSLWHFGALRPSHWLTWGYETPGRAIWQGAYCDDYGQLAFIDEALVDTSNSPEVVLAESEEMLSSVHGAYSTTGFVRKLEKSKFNEPELELWGALISSHNRSVSGKPAKMLEIARTTLRVIQNGAATTAQMECL